MNFVKTFTDGGIVMYPLLAASLLVVNLAIERFIFWSKLRTRQTQLVRTVLELYQSQSTLAIERLDRNLDLPIARIFMAAISLGEATPDEFRLAMESQTHAEMPRLRRFINIFDAVIGLAPLLGLLGTVTGLIASFASLKIGQGTGSNSNNVVGGISEALVSTATGVIVAILASCCANIFRGFYQREISRIYESTGQLELLHRRTSKKFHTSATEVNI
jgi:biopolymer transport protein ExbB